MPFIPHTDDDVKAMLEAIGVDRLEDLFDEIPASLRTGEIPGIPAPLSEMEVTRLVLERAEADGRYLSFLGAGAYEHHIPAAVWQIATRGELYSAYTPYQAEASQGTLQILYEYQSMMAALTAMDVVNGGLYDGASALGEAVLMAVRSHKGGARSVLLPKAVHPAYRQVVRTLTKNQGVDLVELPYDVESGRTLPEALDAHRDASVAALVIPQPNFFGVLEEVDALCAWAHAHGALAVALVNPVSLALLKPPGEWEAGGADIAVGEGQPLGAPLASGGPYFGFMACRKELVRQMPGRIVGRTTDREGRPGFTLTLQAREQHIRRSKATSNICTNQGLMVIAAAIHMALLGPEGLRRVAAKCHANTLALLDKLLQIPGVELAFTAPVFHEAVLKLAIPVRDVLRALEAQGILAGVDLSTPYPELGQAILVCATETKTEGDLQKFADHLSRVMGKRAALPPCAQKPR